MSLFYRTFAKGKFAPKSRMAPTYKKPSAAVSRAYRAGVQAGTSRKRLSYGGGAAKRFKPGFNRTGGYYGRYNRSPGDELKFHDIDVDDAVVTAAGTIQNTGSVNLIAEGTTQSTRLGRKCLIKKILWRYNVDLTDVAAAQGGHDSIRVILYLDKQANGATAVASTAAGIMTSDDFYSFLNLANSSRFHILMDRTHKLKRSAAAGDGTAANDWAGESINGTFYKNCNIPLEFSGITGAITEIRSNNIGVLIFSRVGATLVFKSKMRLRFVG